MAGFWHAEEVDNAKFIKLYVNGVKAFKDLKGPGTKVFELMYRRCNAISPQIAFLCRFQRSTRP